MQLGILETGRVPEGWEDRFGECPAMFERLFQAADPEVGVVVHAVIDGMLPASPGECDAWLVTGSKHGVYDDLPWLDPLKDFLRNARADRVPLIGICFGHQIMAEAFGGRAEKSAKGWGCGVHDYQIIDQPDWLGGAGSSFAMHAMHQDQVTTLPADATRLATSPFCENAMLCYGDPETPDAISIQAHPEFDAPYARALIEMRAGSRIPPDRAAAALGTIGAPVAGEDFARWALAYLHHVRRRRNAA